MQKIYKIIAIILIFIIVLYLLWDRKRSVPNVDEYINKIDSLESIISNIHTKHDSIQVEIDTVYKEITRTKIKYEEIYSTISNNSTNDDYIFFTNYLKERFDSVYNSPTTKAD